MHVVVATTAHPPGDVRVHAKVLSSLLAAGWTATWVGPRPGSVLYGKQDSRVAYKWLPPVRSRTDRLAAGRKLRRVLLESIESCDWIYCPDPDAVPAALALSAQLGVRVWFDIHEEYHVGHASAWLGPLDSALGRRAVQMWIRRLCQRVDLVTSPSPQVLGAYAGDSPNARLLINAAPESFVSATPAARRTDGSPMRVMHGKPGTHRGTREIADALELIGDAGPEIEVLCFGGIADLESAIGIEAAHALTDRTRQTRFQLLDYVDYADVPGILRGCHAGIVNYSGELAGASLPNRLFEYMAVGLQVFAAAESPHIVAILGPHSLGVIFSNSDITSLADALRTAFSNPEDAYLMGQRAREGFMRDFSWEVQMDDLRKWLVLQV